jgi:hypothetical protein
LDDFSRLTALRTSVTKNKEKLSEESASKEVTELEKNLGAMLSYTDLK